MQTPDHGQTTLPAQGISLQVAMDCGQADFKDRRYALQSHLGPTPSISASGSKPKFGGQCHVLVAPCITYGALRHLYLNGLRINIK